MSHDANNTSYYTESIKTFVFYKPKRKKKSISDPIFRSSDLLYFTKAFPDCILHAKPIELQISQFLRE